MKVLRIQVVDTTCGSPTRDVVLVMGHMCPMVLVVGWLWPLPLVYSYEYSVLMLHNTLVA